MKAVKRIIAIGAATFAVALIILFPARVLYQWAAPDNVQVNGISGTIWNGRAAEGTVSGVYFRNLDWQFRPLALARGLLAYRVRLEPAGGFVEGEAGVSFGGNVVVRNLNAALSLGQAVQVALMSGVNAEITLQLDRLELEDGWPTQILGTARVSDLFIRNLSPTPLGSYEAEFQPGEDAIVATIKDISGVLELAGTLRLTPERNYSLIGRVGATNNAPSSVTRQLQLLGSPDSRGLREFRLEGSL
ncbi:MAG: type II secretion system protein N [Woeseiaceae bacterium]|nr:type II secretion system protein N [Woeseiaceae bacterium]